MYLAEMRADRTEQLLAPTDNPIYKDTADEQFEDTAHLKLSNFLIPMGTLFVTLFFVIFYTGDIAANGFPAVFLNAKISLAIMCAMYMGAFAAIIVGAKEKMFTFNQGIEKWISGVVSIMEVNMVVIFAWALAGVAGTMGLKAFIAGLVESSGFSAQLIPAVVFAAGALISFATGSSWGTWALLMPISMPVCSQFGIPLEIAVAATVGGGLFGDHCSPISDTTIKCSMASGSDHLQHVTTQFPFAFTVGISAFVGFVISAYTANLVLSFGVCAAICVIVILLMNKVAAKKYANFDFSKELEIVRKSA